MKKGIERGMKRKSRRERERKKEERDDVCVWVREEEGRKKGRKREGQREDFLFSGSLRLPLVLSLSRAFFSFFLLLNIHHILVSRFLSFCLSLSLSLWLLYKDYTFFYHQQEDRHRDFSLDSLSFIFLRQFFFLSLRRN